MLNNKPFAKQNGSRIAALNFSLPRYFHSVCLLENKTKTVRRQVLPRFPLHKSNRSGQDLNSLNRSGFYRVIPTAFAEFIVRLRTFLCYDFHIEGKIMNCNLVRILTALTFGIVAFALSPFAESLTYMASEPFARLFQILFILFMISPPLIVILLFLIWKELKARNKMK